MKRVISTFLLLTAVFFGGFSGESRAQTPLLIGHQGRLLAPNGKPLSGVQALKFKLYSSRRANRELWSETINVTLQKGYFTATLGLQRALKPSIFRNKELYLGITVGRGGKELLPRVRIVSVPYAILAHTAQNIRGGTVDVREVRVNGKVIIDSKGMWRGKAAGIQGPGCEISNTSRDFDGNTVLTFTCGSKKTRVTVKKGPAGPTGPPGPKGAPGPVGCTALNRIIKSDGQKATCSNIYDTPSGIGIYTNFPRAPLHVNRSILVGNGFNSVAMTNREDGALELSGGGNHLSIVRRNMIKRPTEWKAGDRWAIDNLYGTLGFWTPSAYFLIVTPEGKVGINTKTQPQLLGHLEVFNNKGVPILRVMGGGSKSSKLDNLTIFGKRDTKGSGGRIILQGSDSYQDWAADNTSGTLRFFEPDSTKGDEKKKRGGIEFSLSEKPKNSGNVQSTIRLKIDREETISYQPIKIDVDKKSALLLRGTGNSGLTIEWHNSSDMRAQIGFDSAFKVYSFNLKNDGNTGYFTFNRELKAPKFTTTSDMRLKEEVKLVGGGVLDKLARLKIYSYRLKLSTGRTVGVSADQVEKQFPLLVSRDMRGYKGVNYLGLTALAIKGINELNQKFERLASELNHLRDRSGKKPESSKKKVGISSESSEKVRRLERRLRETEKKYRALQKKLERSEGRYRKLQKKLELLEKDGERKMRRLEERLRLSEERYRKLQEKLNSYFRRQIRD